MWRAPIGNYDQWESSTRRKKRRFTVYGLALTICLIAGSGAVAQSLDGAAIKDLALKGTWATTVSGYGFWSWQEDNSVCVRLYDEPGDCADNGTWSIDGDTLCYELEWWGSELEIKSLCISVHPLEDNLFEARHNDGRVTSVVFQFKILDQ